MKRLLILISLAAAFAVTAFGQADRIGTQQWKLVHLDGVNVAPAARAYLELNAEQTRFTGNTGCNRMFGSVDLKNRRIDFSNIGTTRMACVEPRIRRVETAFVKALENADRYRQSGNSLELYDRNRLVMRLTAPIRQMPED